MNGKVVHKLTLCLIYMQCKCSTEANIAGQQHDAKSTTALAHFSCCIIKAQSAGDAASWSRHTQHEAQTQGSLMVMGKMLQSHVAVRQQEQEQH